MNFQLTKEQEFVQKMVREFAKTEVEPLAAEIDQEHRFPVETVEKMAKYGLLGIPFPTKYGGMGGDEVSYSITHQPQLSYLHTHHYAAGQFISMVQRIRR